MPLSKYYPTIGKIYVYYIAIVTLGAILYYLHVRDQQRRFAP